MPEVRVVAMEQGGSGGAMFAILDSQHYISIQGLYLPSPSIFYLFHIMHALKHQCVLVMPISALVFKVVRS